MTIPLSRRAWARCKEAALIRPNSVLIVVRRTLASIRSATSLRILFCADMSCVPKSERVDIVSQWTERLLGLKGPISSVLGPMQYLYSFLFGLVYAITYCGGGVMPSTAAAPSTNTPRPVSKAMLASSFLNCALPSSASAHNFGIAAKRL